MSRRAGRAVAFSPSPPREMFSSTPSWCSRPPRTRRGRARGGRAGLRPADVRRAAGDQQGGPGHLSHGDARRHTTGALRGVPGVPGAAADPDDAQGRRVRHLLDRVEPHLRPRSEGRHPHPGHHGPGGARPCRLGAYARGSREDQHPRRQGRQGGAPRVLVGVVPQSHAPEGALGLQPDRHGRDQEGRGPGPEAGRRGRHPLAPLGPGALQRAERPPAAARRSHHEGNRDRSRDRAPRARGAADPEAERHLGGLQPGQPGGPALDAHGADRRGRDRLVRVPGDRLRVGRRRPLPHHSGGHPTRGGARGGAPRGAVEDHRLVDVGRVLADPGDLSADRLARYRLAAERTRGFLFNRGAPGGDGLAELSPED